MINIEPRPCEDDGVMGYSGQLANRGEIPVENAWDMNHVIKTENATQNISIAADYQ